jgi:hypothetical protein
MNTFKNLLIAILTGLLALSLFTQPAQSAPKTYDAVKLAQYEACLALLRQERYSLTTTYQDAITNQISLCSPYRPK